MIRIEISGKTREDICRKWNLLMGISESLSEVSSEADAASEPIPKAVKTEAAPNLEQVKRLGVELSKKDLDTLRDILVQLEVPKLTAIDVSQLPLAHRLLTEALADG